MKSARTFFIGMFTIIFSALLYFYSTGMNNYWILLWFAPLPVLLFSLRYNLYASFIVAFLSYLLGSASILYYAKTPFPINSLLTAAFIEAFYFGLIIVVTRWVIRRIRNWSTIFIFPALWTAYEFMGANDPASGTLPSIAYSQIHFLSFIQLASITGIWGLTFILCLVPSAFAVAYYLRMHKFSSVMSLILGVGILFAALIFGIVQLHHVNQQKALRVALVTVPVNTEDLHSTDAETVTHTIENYAHAIDSLKNQHVDIVLLPEKIARVLTEKKHYVFSRLSEVARDNQVMLVVGLTQFENTKYNIAHIYASNGSLVDTYVKKHLLSWSEADFIPGQSLTTFKVDNNLAGVAICKDMDFIEPAKEYGQLGVGIMFVPALDFIVDDEAHAKPSIMQGVANGYAVVRAAQWGLLTVSDAQGRIISSVPASDTSSIVLMTTVRPGTGKTFYSDHGNWFIWLDLGIGVVLLIYSMMGARRITSASMT